MKTFSLAAAAMLIASATALHAEQADSAVTVVASANAGSDAALPTSPPAQNGPAAIDKTAVPVSTDKAAAPVAPAQSDTPKASDEKAVPAKRPATVHSARFANGEGSVWKASRGGYEFTGSYRGCHYRGYVNGSGYHVDKSC